MEYTLDVHASIAEIFIPLQKPKNFHVKNRLNRVAFAFEIPEKELPPTEPEPEKKDNPHPNEDLPKLPTEIPPFEKEIPEVPRELPPFKEDFPQSPQEIPPFKEIPSQPPLENPMA